MLHMFQHDDRLFFAQPPKLAVYHKPFGVHSTMGDPLGRPSLGDLSNSFLKHMHPVGRLDADTTGLLLWSKDGQLTHTLLDPSMGVDRIYEAWVVGEVQKEELSCKLSFGVPTGEGSIIAKLVNVCVVK